MNYNQFIATIKDKVLLSFDDNFSIQIHKALKNNGRKRIGLTITDTRINVSPTIYLEEYFHLYTNGVSLETIAEQIVNTYHEVKFKQKCNVQTIKDFSTIRHKVAYKIIHGDKNKQLLQTHPHIIYLDFAIVFYILYDIDESGSATIPITHELLKCWETSTDELWKLARINTPLLLPADYKPMQVVIKEMLGELYTEDGMAENLMYVLTNSLRTFGACCLLYDGILEQIGDKLGENFYLLPSSIHEIIIVPESKSPDEDCLHEMVVDINESQVAEEEFLSDNVYYYNRLTKQII